MLNFLFLNPKLFWPHLQSFLFLSLVPDTETSMLGVILDFSTPSVPIQLQDSLDSFWKIGSLKMDAFIFPFLPASPHGLVHNNRFIIGCFYHDTLPTSPVVAINATRIFLSISLSTLSSPQHLTLSHYFGTHLVVLLIYQIIQTIRIKLL